MASNNGANPSDKVQTGTKPIPTVSNYDNINDGLYMVISDTVNNVGTRFLTEGFDVNDVGVVQRDTIFDERGVSSNVTMIPGVRIVVHRNESGEKDGYEYIGKHSLSMDESRSRKAKLR